MDLWNQDCKTLFVLSKLPKSICGSLRVIYTKTIYTNNKIIYYNKTLLTSGFVKAEVTYADINQINLFTF